MVNYQGFFPLTFSLLIELVIVPAVFFYFLGNLYNYEDSEEKFSGNEKLRRNYEQIALGL